MWAAITRSRLEEHDTGVNPGEKSGHKRPQDKSPEAPMSPCSAATQKKPKWKHRGHRIFQRSTRQTLLPLGLCHHFQFSTLNTTTTAMQTLRKSPLVLRLLCVSATLKHLGNKGETPNYDF